MSQDLVEGERHGAALPHEPERIHDKDHPLIPLENRYELEIRSHTRVLGVHPVLLCGKRDPYSTRGRGRGTIFSLIFLRRKMTIIL
jgi:hypothetical protein